MMLEQLRKKLDLNWIKKNNVWDVVLYGSYARGKTDSNDIDLAIILKEKISVKNKMILGQELRKMLAFKGIVLDVKMLDFDDLLNPGVLNRESVLSEGISIIKKDYVAERFGFAPFVLIEYELKKLTPSKKKMFYYALQGRTKGTGILAQIKGTLISNEVIKIPLKSYEEIKSLLEEHAISYKATFLLQYRILQ